MKKVLDNAGNSIYSVFQVLNKRNSNLEGTNVLLSMCHNQQSLQALANIIANGGTGVWSDMGYSQDNADNRFEPSREGVRN